MQQQNAQSNSGNAGGQAANNNARAPGSQSFTKKVQTKILDTCTDKMLVTANIVALGTCAAGCAIRFAYVFSSDGTAKPADYNGATFFLSTLFNVVFIALVGMSLLGYDNQLGQKVRCYFLFLDYYVGRGLFLLFIGLFLIEMPDALQIIFFIIVCFVVLADMVIGMQEIKNRKNLPEMTIV